jgi:acetyltransferase-like isoleucine patch superfamily enzyme
MIIKLLFYFLNIISLDRLKDKIYCLLLTNKLTLGEKSKIYKSAVVENFQGNKLCIQIGQHTHVKGELLVFPHGGNIFIGNYSYIGEGTRIWSALDIHIGNNVLIAHNVNIHDNISHPIEAEARHSHYKHIITKGHPKKDVYLSEKPIYINNDAWIGFNATILKGTTIGKGAVIGACSVVTKDVPENAIVVGNPAQVIGYVKNNK